MHVCMYGCMHACMHIYIYIIFIYTYIILVRLSVPVSSFLYIFVLGGVKEHWAVGSEGS